MPVDDVDLADEPEAEHPSPGSRGDAAGRSRRPKGRGPRDMSEPRGPRYHGGAISTTPTTTVGVPARRQANGMRKRQIPGGIAPPGGPHRGDVPGPRRGYSPRGPLPPSGRALVHVRTTL